LGRFSLAGCPAGEIMVEIQVEYRGQLRCEARHSPSGMSLLTDAPVDNKGRGEAFSPTDLLATALGTCMLTVMGIRAQEHQYPLEGTRLSVKKHMAQSGPRRVARLDVSVQVPRGGEIAEPARRVLEQAANTCPVRLSILEAIEVPVHFDWDAPR
jgi:putative redox protein